MRINITPPTHATWTEYMRMFAVRGLRPPPKTAGCLLAILTEQREGEWDDAKGLGLADFDPTGVAVAAGVSMSPTDGQWVLVDHLATNPGIPMRWRHGAVAALMRPTLAYCAALGKAPLALVTSKSLARILLRDGWAVRQAIAMAREPTLNTSVVLEVPAVEPPTKGRSAVRPSTARRR